MALAQLAFDPGERTVRDGRVETVACHVVDGSHHPSLDLPGEIRIAPVDATPQDQPRTNRLHGMRPECHRRSA